MCLRSIRNAVVGGLAVVIVSLASPSASRAELVDPGWDLFQTVVPQTMVLGDSYAGVPLGSFNFGGTIGTQPTGATDTIVQRLGGVSAPAGGAGTIPIQFLALQLMSVAPVDFTKFGGSGLHTAFLTPHGTQSAGSMNITFDPASTAANQFGTFTATLPVSFDVRQDTLGGPIIASGSSTLTSAGNWTHTAPTGATLIPGVNLNLNGTDNTNDFWPGGPIGVSSDRGRTSLTQTAQGGLGTQVVNAAGLGSSQITPVPEPSSAVLLISAGLAGLIGWGRKRSVKMA
jgi:hypothetical protein